MASADLRTELECSLCLNVFTDPVNLECGHNFCPDCIDGVLDTQEDYDYSCPQCGETFPQRPALHKNITLRNIVESFRSAQQGNTIFCTYCIHASVPAVKSCLHCEASLCDDHLKGHSKSPEHVLCDPTTSLENRKCPVHKKVLEYYCVDDAACLCVSCTLAVDHQGHQVEMMEKAFFRKRRKLKNVLQELREKKEKVEKRVQNLQEHKKKVEEKAADEAKRMTVLIEDLRKWLEKLEKRVLGEISGQVEKVSLSVSDLIQQLEQKNKKLSKKIHYVRELCDTVNSATILQESDTGDLSNTEEDDEDKEIDDKQIKDVGDLDVTLISNTLHKLRSIVIGFNGGVFTRQAEDIILDLNTANNELAISGDRRSAQKSSYQNRPETPMRFLWYPQVLSTQSFFSGRHYWDVDVSGSHHWRIGMSYPSIARRQDSSMFGHNYKSWGLYRSGNWYSAIYNKKKIRVPHYGCINRVRVYLDYKAGQICFCNLSDPIEHLHTFTARFKEPLHAAICVWRGSVKLSVGDWEW